MNTVKTVSLCDFKAKDILWLLKNKILCNITISILGKPGLKCETKKYKNYVGDINP